MPFDHIQERIGTLVAGRYRLLRMIGEGGMGAVFEADHLDNGSRVAVKLIKPEFARSSEVNARFIQEAVTVAAIGHPNIVRVLDAGSDDEGPYMVLELLEGETLGDVLDRRPLGPREALTIAGEMLDALGAAHHAGVIHRDIKPENIFLVGGADHCHGVKLLDFGISKILSGDPGGGLTRVGMAVGTPDYMSPEQASGSRIDGRADLWSVGAVLYESIAQTLPFDGENYQQLMARILMSPHVPLRDRVPDVPHGVSAIIDRALSKDASQRYGSAAEMLAAVCAVRDALPSDDAYGGHDDPTGVIAAPAAIPETFEPTLVRAAPPPLDPVHDTPVVPLAVPPWPSATPRAAPPGEPSRDDAFTQSATTVSPGAVPPQGVTAITWTAAQPPPSVVPPPPVMQAPRRRTGLVIGAAVLVVIGGTAIALVIAGVQHPAAPPTAPRRASAPEFTAALDAAGLPPPSPAPLPSRSAAPVVAQPIAPPVMPPVAPPIAPPVAQSLVPASPVAAPDAGVGQVVRVMPAPDVVAPPRASSHVHGRHGREPTHARAHEPAHVRAHEPAHVRAHEPSPAGPPLTAAEVMPALRPLLPPLQNCARGVGGNVDAYLTIDARGAVRAVRLEGPFAHSPAAPCVTHALHGARFPQGRPSLGVRIVFGLPR